jgi:hypothetical protein
MAPVAEGRVFRASGRRLPQDPLEQRIVELGDGRSAGEITDILYVEEIRAGAWIVDIALWKHLFDDSVAVTIRELADKGYLRVEPNSGSDPRAWTKLSSNQGASTP